MKKTLFLLALLVAKTFLSFGQDGNHQPYVNYWFPDSLLNWNPATDTSSPFNRGIVPLATRFIDSNSSPCYVTRSPNVKVMCLSVGNSTTSFNPSQGYDHAGEYAFNFWQYTDYFVMWGGSAGEGLILAPNPTWIDAAHRNGVKVMGTIFLPPTQYGGQIQWVNDLTQSNGSDYPVADKLIQVANYYGFDGWFINQETGGGNSTTGTAMINFMEYLQQNKPANMEIIWYDAMLPNGSIYYENQLNSANVDMFEDGGSVVSNDFFLNYNWNSTYLANSKAEAISVGRSQFDVDAGIDVSENGYNTNVGWTNIFPTIANPNVSVGLFEPSWTFHSSPDKNNIPLIDQREEEFWVGADSSPCHIPTSGWPGFAKYVIEKSAITSWPFITRFNTGQGTDGCWIEGNQLSNHQWNNVSDQDVLPTWRWSPQSSGTPLDVNWDFTNAYNGGNSLKVSGALGSSNTTTIPLYNTKLPVTANSNLSITYDMGSAGASDMQVAIAFTDAPTTYTYLDCGSATSSSWNTKSFSLSAYAGKTLCVVGLQFASSSTISNYSMNIGEIALTNATASAPAAPTNLQLTSYINCENAEFKINFDTSASGSIWYYDFYRVLPGGSLQWLGRTPDNAYYIKNIKRVDYETTGQIEVVAVNTSGMSSAPVTQTFNWPANSTNYSVKLNGTNQYLNTGLIDLDGSAITLEGWVNADSFKTASPNISAIMGIDDTMQNTALLRIGNATIANNKVQFALNVGGTVKTLTSSATLNAGTWYHIAGVYNGAQMAIYINGAQDTTMAATGVVKASGHFYIGRDSVASSTGYLNGSVDELRAWLVARSQSDIGTDQCNVSPLSDSLAAYWTFNDCTPGVIAYDYASNHDGIPYNMSAADWIAGSPCPPLGISAITPPNTLDIKLYPNPLVNGAALTLEIPNFSVKAECYIFDETGRLIHNQAITQTTTQIETGRLSPGIYIYKVVENSSIKTGKLVIIQ